MIDIYFFGKIKNKNLKKLINYYEKLVSRNLRINYKSIKESKNSNIDNKKKEESKRALAKIEKDRNYVVVLDEKGKLYSSNGLVKIVNNRLKRGTHISFYIGNYYGFEKKVKDKADLLLSLSNLTFNHELSMLILLEQLYRIENKIFGGSYHK